MIEAPLMPSTSALRLDESAQRTSYRYLDSFSIERVETIGSRPSPIQKSSSVPALLLSTFLKPVAPDHYRLWFDGKAVPIGAVPAFRVNIVDLAAGPAMWAARGADYVHFHVRKKTVDETAATLGYDAADSFRLAIAQEDLLLAQLTKSILQSLGTDSPPTRLALDQLELIIAAHVLQRYGSARQRQPSARYKLAPWRRQRATELIRENLDGKLGLSELARACELSVSHFARSFKATFGVSSHRWLIERRIEQAQALMLSAKSPLADVAIRAGFADQPSFTRAFRRVVGTSPARWRRENR